MKNQILYLLQLLENKLVLSLLFLSLATNNSYSQECGTPDIQPEEAMNFPWFGSPDYLPAFMDSLVTAEDTPSQTPTISSIVSDVKWRIPIKFWIFTTGARPDPARLLDDGEETDLPEERELQRLLDDANNAFRNTEVPSKIQFYMREAERVVTAETAPSAREIVRFTQNGFGTRFYDNEAINVYITTRGDSYFNSDKRYFVTLTRSRYGGRISATTMAHELGHYLGLWHTHQFTAENLWCWREPVSRNAVSDPGCILPINFPILPARRCSYTGDFLCDTEADPDMSEHRYIDSLCMYDDDARDYLGVRFRPLEDNYMSYGNRSCRATFTKDQVGSMWWALQATDRGKSGLWKVDAAGRSFDIYEPNNTISGAVNVPTATQAGRRGIPNNLLRIDEPQLHSFHRDLDGNVMDNEDWIPIERPESGILENYIITVETSDIANLIEDIEVFTAVSPNGLSIPSALFTRLVSASTPNQTLWTISIPCDSINSPTPLYLRVRRNQNLNEFGTYTVLAQSSNADVEISVVGEPETICTGTTYRAKLENFTLTPDFSIVWQDSVSFDNGTSLPLSEILSARNRIQTNFSTSELSGVFVLQATITNNKTGCSETIERRFRIGKIPEANLQIITELRPPDVCPDMLFSLQMNLLRSNGIDYDQVEEIEWTSSNPAYTFVTSPNEETVIVQAPPTANRWTVITLRARNACGWTETEIEYTTLPLEDCNLPLGNNPIDIYPNPTADFILINVLCMCAIDPEAIIDPNSDPIKYSISRVDISDIFGATQLSYEGGQIPVNSDGKIYLNLSPLPAGNYVLKLIMQNEVYMKHVIKQ